jgi:pimeloyl-ACP methyl ester carboxylesterase
MQRITSLADMRPEEQQLQLERLPPATYEACEHFIARMQLGGLEWGDITHALLGLQKASIYEGWDDWHDRWASFGRTYEVRAEEAECQGSRVTQRQWLLKASACYHYGQFMYFDDEEKKSRSRQKVTELFHRALPYLDHEIRMLSVPYRDLQLPAYFMPAPGPGPSPCVILVNALESSTEVEMYSFAKEFQARGCSVFMFDGPGQGLLSKDYPLDPRFERVFEPVLKAVMSLPEVDPDRLGLCGASFGGHLVSRLAALFPREIKAVINISGGFDHDAFLNMNVMVRKDFRHVFHQSSDEGMAQLARESLHLRDLPGMTARLLMVGSQKDIIIPYESFLRVMEWAQGDTALLTYPGTRHVCTSYFSDYVPRMTDWMVDALVPAQH